MNDKNKHGSRNIPPTAQQAGLFWVEANNKLPNKIHDKCNIYLRWIHSRNNYPQLNLITVSSNQILCRSNSGCYSDVAREHEFDDTHIELLTLENSNALQLKLITVSQAVVWSTQIEKQNFNAICTDLFLNIVYNIIWGALAKKSGLAVS